VQQRLQEDAQTHTHTHTHTHAVSHTHTHTGKAGSGHSAATAAEWLFSRLSLSHTNMRAHTHTHAGKAMSGHVVAAATDAAAQGAAAGVFGVPELAGREDVFRYAPELSRLRHMCAYACVCTCVFCV